MDLSNFRQRTAEMLQEAVADGRLAATLTAQRAGKKAAEENAKTVELQSICQKARITLQSSLANGRLAEVVRGLVNEKTIAVDSARQQQEAEELEFLRQDVRNVMQSSLRDGSLLKVIESVKEEKKAKKDLESMSQEVRKTLQLSLLDGRLSQAIESVRQEKKAKELEAMRQDLRETFSIALRDGQLSTVMQRMHAEKQARQVSAARENCKNVLASASLNGRLLEAMNAVKQDKLDSTRIAVRKTLHSSLRDGSLSEAVTTVKNQTQATADSESARRNVCRSLQSSLVDGRLSAILAGVKRQDEAKELEAMRQEMQVSLQSALADGRISGILSSITEKKRANEAVKDPQVAALCWNHTYPLEAPATAQHNVAMACTPAKPAYAKTATRPARRSSLRATSVSEHSTTTCTLVTSDVSDSSPVLKPPKLPTLGSEMSSPTRNSLSFAFTMADLSTLSRPASPRKTLPPVAPPSKVLQAVSASHQHARPSVSKPSAMSLDLGPAPSPPSAMMLDLDDNLHSDLGPGAAVKPPSKHTPCFLPPLSGKKAPEGFVSKASAHKRSVSVDAFAWGVGPVDSHLGWKVVF
jgi:hypothetical protein